MANNNDNLEWNTLHGGVRVPINDSGEDGAPFALGSHDVAWEDGSVNKAVKTMMEHQGNSFLPADSVDGLAGKLNLAALIKYADKGLMYGFQGDAKGSLGGDMMAYRGYPTVSVNLTWSLEECVPCYRKLLDGSDDSSPHVNWIYFPVLAELEQTMPYDVIVSVHIAGNYSSQYNPESRWLMKIPSGSLIASEAKLIDDVSWLTLTNGLAYLGIHQEFGDMEFTLEFENATGSTPVYEGDILPTNILTHNGGLPTYSYVMLDTKQSQPCQNTGVSGTYYASALNPQIGDYFYTDSNGTIPVVGDGFWWWYDTTYEKSYVMNSVGEIINLATCPL